MGLFFSEVRDKSASKAAKRGVSVETLHRMECSGCPLNNADVYSPKMQPTGSDEPIIYVLGEAPGADEDSEGEQFVGKAGKMLRPLLRDIIDACRFNNVIRTRPPKNRNPNWMEIECCRPSIVRDIERTEPIAIFGFGMVPLKWAIEVDSGITRWRGRHTPIRIGKHACWYFPMLHPSYVGRKQGGAEEAIFKADIKNAIDLVLDGLPDPEDHLIEEPDYAKHIVKFAGMRPDEFEELVGYFSDLSSVYEVCAVDIETNGLRPYTDNAKILSVAFSTPDWHIAIALDHPQAMWSEEARNGIDAMISRVLSDPSITKVAHNLAFELEWFSHFYGIEIMYDSSWGDTQAQAFILDSRSGVLSLDALCQLHFGVAMKSISNIDVLKLEQFPILEVLDYNGIDTFFTLPLFEAQNKIIEAEGLQEVYEAQVRRIPTTILSTAKGCRIDQGEIAKHKVSLGAALTKVEIAINKQPVVIEYEERKGKPLKPGSPAEVAVVFRDLLEFDQGFNKKGGYSTDESVLSRINHPLSKLILEYRTLVKNKSTYVDSLAVGGEYLGNDGRMHPQFNTMKAQTRRLSSSNPNGQNFPARKNREIRSVVVPEVGHSFVSIDYGQIEARVIAMASKDKNLMASTWDNEDIHRKWTVRLAEEYPRRIGGIDKMNDPKVMSTFRTDIKNQWTFPLFFGAQASSVAKYLNIPMQVINPLVEEFWDDFSEIREWQKGLLKFYKENGYVETLTKFRRPGPLDHNQIINSPIQGTASDIVIDAMNRVSEHARATQDWNFQPLLNIHDDLSFSFPTDNLDDYLDTTIGIMLDSSFDFVNVPLSVEVKVGPDWNDQEEVGTYYSHEWKR